MREDITCSVWLFSDDDIVRMFIAPPLGGVEIETREDVGFGIGLENHGDSLVDDGEVIFIL